MTKDQQTCAQTHLQIHQTGTNNLAADVALTIFIMMLITRVVQEVRIAQQRQHGPSQKWEKGTNGEEPYATSLHPQQNHRISKKQEENEKGDGNKKGCKNGVQEGPNKAVGGKQGLASTTTTKGHHTTAATDTAQKFSGEEKYRVKRQP